jgi:hypothetical protein
LDTLNVDIDIQAGSQAYRQREPRRQAELRTACLHFVDMHSIDTAAPHVFSSGLRPSVALHKWLSVLCLTITLGMII